MSFSHRLYSHRTLYTLHYVACPLNRFFEWIMNDQREGSLLYHQHCAAISTHKTFQFPLWRKFFSSSLSSFDQRKVFKELLWIRVWMGIMFWSGAERWCMQVVVGCDVSDIRFTVDDIIVFLWIFSSVHSDKAKNSQLETEFSLLNIKRTMRELI